MKVSKMEIIRQLELEEKIKSILPRADLINHKFQTAIRIDPDKITLEELVELMRQTGGYYDGDEESVIVEGLHDEF